MKTSKNRILLPIWLAAGLAGSAALLSASPEKAAAAANDSQAEQAWLDLLQSGRMPQVPAAWRQARPSEEEIAAFRKTAAEQSIKAADKAKEFYTRFPVQEHSAGARQKERELLGQAVMLGATNQNARLVRLENLRLKEPGVTEDEKFQLRAAQTQRAAMLHKDEGMTAILDNFLVGARQLQKEFPNRPEVYEMLMEVATESDPAKAKPIAEEVAKSGGAPERIRQAAQSLLDRFGMVGQPVPIQFTAVDGRPVDLQKMKGKVVLVDFWATWCGPCVGELPHVKAAYDRLHPQGFEIVGISFDQSRDKLEQFVKDREMAWPQYFDGLVWQNKIGRKYGINSIPTMWLIDKKGALRDLNAREDLAGKVEKLLAEKD